MLGAILHRAEQRARKAAAKVTGAIQSRWSHDRCRKFAGSAVRLAQPRIEPAHIIAWPLWRRVHHAAEQQGHQKKQRA